ncbi:MAG: KTSC domain-containing protein [Candidatus Riflebacteria bacterium]|nr:KTSC domain-containing protein [Candidatus Riflebacteria bacterium]
MERTPVTSTNLKSIGYDPDSQILEVEFNAGSIYQYANVPPGEHEGLMNADSKGRYLNMNIKGRYSFARL